MRYEETPALNTARELTMLLARISGDDVLWDRMALHGGAAINAFYFDLPRLSVDIDVSYLGDESFEEMRDVRPEVLAVVGCAQAQGYSTRLGKNQPAGRSVRLAGRGEPTKADVNFMNRIPLYEPQVLASSIDPSVSFPVLAPADVFGGKVRAVLGRERARDLFDVGTILDNVGLFDESELHPALLLYATLSDRFPKYQADGRFAEDVTSERFCRLDEEIATSLAPMLPASVPVPTAPTLLSRAREFISAYVEPRDATEREYVSLMERGDFHPELILPEGVAQRALRFPEAVWKVQKLEYYNSLRQDAGLGDDGSPGGRASRGDEAI